MPSRLTERMKMFIFLLHHREGRSMREVSRITGHAQVSVKRVLDALPLETDVSELDQAQIDSYVAMSPVEWAEVKASFPSAEERNDALDQTLKDLWAELGPRGEVLMYPKMADEPMGHDRRQDR